MPDTHAHRAIHVLYVLLCLPRNVTQPQPFFPEPLHLARISPPPRNRKEIVSDGCIKNRVIESHLYDKNAYGDAHFSTHHRTVAGEDLSSRMDGEKAVSAGVSLLLAARRRGR